MSNKGVCRTALATQGLLRIMIIKNFKSYVMCHVSGVTCHMLRVTCHMLLMPTATDMGPLPANTPTMHSQNEKNLKAIS